MRMRSVSTASPVASLSLVSRSAIVRIAVSRSVCGRPTLTASGGSFSSSVLRSSLILRRSSSLSPPSRW
jgi:hypothetical protein